MTNSLLPMGDWSVKTFEEGLEDYYDMKIKGLVRISGRVPGDEREFGPISDAVM